MLTHLAESQNYMNQQINDLEVHTSAWQDVGRSVALGKSIILLRGPLCLVLPLSACQHNYCFQYFNNQCREAGRAGFASGMSNLK